MRLVHELLNPTDFSTASLSEDAVLFDIETTGLSADTSYLYLIGAIYRTADGLTLSQWFCDEYSEEKEVLASFLSFLKGYSTLIHYNGTGFDIPYLNKKMKRHCLQGFIDSSTTIDLYKLLHPFKKYTSLPDFKQKTLEEAAGFYREDTFSGGDLIEVYAAYAGKSRLAALTGKTEEADALRHVLFLHNHDDLLGLLRLYQNTHLAAWEADALTPSVIQFSENLLFTFDFPLLPFPLTITKNGCTFAISKKTTDLYLPLSRRELKYFFKDYKNYTYLKYEDTAVHNSVAEWVDKEAKERCKPSTAYQKKEGDFVMLPFTKPEQENALAEIPLFYIEHKSLPAFLEYSPEILCRREFIQSCFKAFLKAK